MKSLRAEMKPWNIHVSNINPGFFRYISVVVTKYGVVINISFRTAIVTGNCSTTENLFKSLPSELRDQYSSDMIQFTDNLDRLLEVGGSEIYIASKEMTYVYVDDVVDCAQDPELVVTAIVEALTDSSPPM